MKINDHFLKKIENHEAHLTHISVLRDLVSDFHIKPVDWEVIHAALSVALKKNKGIFSLYYDLRFTENPPRHTTVISIINFLKHHPQINKLQWQENFSGRFNIEKLFSYVAISQIKHFSFHAMLDYYDKTQPEGPSILSQSLKQLLQKNTSLESLSITGYQLTYQETLDLLKQTAQHPTLSQLEIKNSTLTLSSIPSQELTKIENYFLKNHHFQKLQIGIYSFVEIPNIARIYFPNFIQRMQNNIQLQSVQKILSEKLLKLDTQSLQSIYQLSMWNETEYKIELLNITQAIANVMGFYIRSIFFNQSTKLGNAIDALPIEQMVLMESLSSFSHPQLSESNKQAICQRTIQNKRIEKLIYSASIKPKNPLLKAFDYLKTKVTGTPKETLKP